MILTFVSWFYFAVRLLAILLILIRDAHLGQSTFFDFLGNWPLYRVSWDCTIPLKQINMYETDQSADIFIISFCKYYTGDLYGIPQMPCDILHTTYYIPHDNLFLICL